MAGQPNYTNETNVVGRHKFLFPAITFNNLAVGGTVHTDYIAAEADVNALRVPGALNVYALQWGSNDMPTSFSHATLLALPLHVNRMRAAGWIIVLLTQLPRSDATYNSRRNTYLNPTIRGEITAGRADFCLDWGADSVIGTDAAGSDTDIIYDGTHPSTYTHQYGYANHTLAIINAITKPRYVLSWRGSLLLQEEGTHLLLENGDYLPLED